MTSKERDAIERVRYCAGIGAVGCSREDVGLVCAIEAWAQADLMECDHG